MKKYIIITADTNDGDYITEKTLITDEQIELIKPIIEEIKKNNGDFGVGEAGWRNPSKEEYTHMKGYDLFMEIIPYGENGFHSIDSIEVITVVETEKLL